MTPFAHGRFTDLGFRRSWPVVFALVVVLGIVAASCASDTSGEETQTNDSASEGDGATSTSAPGDAAAPCDVSVNSVAYYEDADLAGTLGADHAGMDMGEPASTMPEGMDHSATDMGEMDGSTSTTVDEPMDMSGGMGELEAAALVTELAEMDDASYEQWLQSLDPTRDVEAPDDTGRGGHLGPQTWTHMTDAAECEQLASELETARGVADAFPKAADASAAGYVRVAPYLPGIASHWMNFGLVDGEFDVTQPEMLLYDGNEEDANLVGLSYFIRADGDAEPEVGFTGDNDHYHRHEGLCLGDEGVIGDSTMTEAECEAIGGHKSDGGSGWMSHAWVVEGCASPWGVFSAQNPLLDGPLGASSGAAAPCSGSEVASRWDLAPAEPD